MRLIRSRSLPHLPTTFDQGTASVNTETDIKSELLSPSELAARYKGRVTERTLANWRSTGQGPRFIKVGGRVMYCVKSVKDWEQRRTSPDRK